MVIPLPILLGFTTLLRPRSVLSFPDRSMMLFILVNLYLYIYSEVVFRVSLQSKPSCIALPTAGECQSLQPLSSCTCPAGVRYAAYSEHPFPFTSISNRLSIENMATEPTSKAKGRKGPEESKGLFKPTGKTGILLSHDRKPSLMAGSNTVLRT